MRIERECPFRLDDAIPKTRLKTGASGLRQQPRAGRAEFFALPAAFAASPRRRIAASPRRRIAHSPFGRIRPRAS